MDKPLKEKAKANKSWLLVIVVILAVLGTGLLISSRSKLTFQRGPTPVREYKFSSINIKSSLNKGATEKLANFLSDVFQSSYLPTDLVVSLVAAGKEGRGDEYLGNWFTEAKNLNVLYVSSPNPNSPRYLRVWILSPSKTIDRAQASSLIKGLFTDKFSQLADNLNCVETKDDQERSFSVCSNLVAGTDGEKYGVLVHAPLYTADGRELTVVSACAIPKSSPDIDRVTYCE